MFAKNRKESKTYLNDKGGTVENSAQNEKVFESLAQIVKELKSLGEDHAQAIETERACWNFLNIDGCFECPTNVVGDTRSCNETIAAVTAERLEKILKNDPEPKQTPKRVKIGDVLAFPNVKPDKAQAHKVLEEAAEVFAAWQKWETYKDYPSNYIHEESDLLDELADVIQACVNLISAFGITNFELAMAQCETRNRKRGRYNE